MPRFEDCVQAFRNRASPAGCGGEGGQIAVAPCCSGLSSERMLHRREWVEILLERLKQVRSGAILHFLGGPADREYIESIMGELKIQAPWANLDNHAGEMSLSQPVRLLGGMRELQCIDSGMLHFARLLGVKTVSYWGPTDPKTLMRPSLAGADTVSYYRLPCSPCVHLASQAPCRGNNVCMRLAVSPARAASLSSPAWLAIPVPLVASEGAAKIATPGGFPVA